MIDLRKSWRNLSTRSRVFVLVLALFFALLLGAVTYLSIEVSIQEKQIERLNNAGIEKLENQRQESEAVIKTANDSIETLNTIIALRDDSIKTLNDDFKELETQDQENDVFVASLDSTGIIDVLKGIRAKYGIH